MAQLGVLADLYATALEHLEPEAVPRVRATMCNATSDEARRIPLRPARCATGSRWIFWKPALTPQP